MPAPLQTAAPEPGGPPGPASPAVAASPTGASPKAGASPKPGQGPPPAARRKPLPQPGSDTEAEIPESLDPVAKAQRERRRTRKRMRNYVNLSWWHVAADGNDRPLADYFNGPGPEHRLFHIDYRNKHVFGRTALMAAAGRGHARCVKLLLERGAAPNPLDYTGHTALTLAAEGGHRACVAHLLDRGADANYETPDGWTLLKLALSLGHEDVLQELADRRLEPADAAAVLGDLGAGCPYARSDLMGDAQLSLLRVCQAETVRVEKVRAAEQARIQREKDERLRRQRREMELLEAERRRKAEAELQRREEEVRKRMARR